MSKDNLLEEIIPEITLEFKKIVDYLYGLGRTPTLEEMEAVCRAGMRWTEEGAGAIAALMAKRLSGCWDRCWQPVRQPLLA